MKHVFFLLMLSLSVIYEVCGQRIARDMDMGLMVNHVGYIPEGGKTVVVKGLIDRRFKVINAVTATVAFEGSFQSAKGDFGDYSTGDFSALTEEGTYYVKADTLRSYPFRIASNVYTHPLDLLVGYFALQRCGASATGYLSPCHTDDGVRLDNGKHQDVSGGWHDASDLRKWVNCTIYGITGLARAYQLLDYKSVLREKIYEELMWGNDYFLKMQEPDGYVMSFIGGEIRKHRDGNRWTDGETGVDGGELHLAKPTAGESSEDALIFGDKDDRIIQTDPADRVAQYNFVAAEAMMAQIARDKSYAYKCLLAAEKCFRWCKETDKDLDAGAVGASVIAAIELFNATKNTEYQEFAVSRASLLRQLQIHTTSGASGFFRTSVSNPEPYKTIWQGPLELISICDLFQTFPSHPNAPDWKKMIEDYSIGYLRFFSHRNSFGIIPYGLFIGKQDGGRRIGDYWYRYFMHPDLSWWVGINANIASAGVGLMKAAAILGKPELKGIAQRQLDWILGMNPFNSSTVVGVGYNQPRQFINQDQFRPYTPLLPGAVMNGLGGDRNDNPFLITENNYNQSEYWTPMVSYTLWLMGEISRTGEAIYTITNLQ